MSFNVAAEGYDQLMGHYSAQLAAPMADLAGVRSGQRVIDVGCGPGALTAELAKRVGADHVVAIDPSEQFVAAARARFPAVDVRQGFAESLPLEKAAFDAALAQLVVHFMKDPVGGVREMARVTKAGGAVVACVWDHFGGRAPLSPFYRAVDEVDPGGVDETGFAGVREGHLVEIFGTAGLTDVTGTVLSASRTHATFDEWWTPFTFGIGPAGAYVKRASPELLGRIREAAHRQLGDGPFTVTSHAWAARGLA